MHATTSCPVRRVAAVLLIAGLLGAVGCSRPSRPVIAVQGKILFADGKALPAGTKLLFNPAEGDTGTATGVASDDGSFRVTHVTGRSGAETGKYTVVLRPPQGQEAAFYQMVPRDYYDAGAFAVEVKEGMAPLDLKVAHPARRG